MKKKDSQEQLLDLIFSADGLMSRCLSDFEERKEQTEMAKQVLSVYQEEGVALAEAGTGIGKSLAYLVPAVLWALKNKEKTVISTHTISLQEQLIQKDIPFLLKALDVELKAVLVKGMNNYLCLRKLEEVKQQQKSYLEEVDEDFERFEVWAETTRDGSKSTLPQGLPSGYWDRAQAESDSCNHVHCPFYKQCFFFKARRQAMDAQILVVNHSLFFTDLSSKTKANAKEEKSAFPDVERVIFDEAHHIEDVALDSLSKRTDRQGLLQLLHRISSDTPSQNSRLNLIRYEISKKIYQIDEKRLKSIIQRLEIDLPAEKRNLITLIEEAFEAIDGFCQKIFTESEQDTREKKWRLKKETLTHPSWLNEVKPRFDNLLNNLKRFVQALAALGADLEALKDENIASHSSELQALTLRLEENADVIEHFFSCQDDVHRVQYIEMTGLQSRSNISLVDAQIDLSSYLKEHLFDRLSTVALCSATLTMGKGFEYLKERLGIDHPKVLEKVYHSPFDYQNRTLLVVPADIPNPTESTFISAASECILKSIIASQGNAFVLFTSYDMLRQCYDRVSSLLKEEKFHLLRQGDAARHALLEKFKSKEGSILFATDSFWEGVDVAGEALRCVILAKLPFKVPNDPLIEAHSEWLTSQGKDPFFDYAVPQAVMKFKQGFGRLMRKKSDRGCIVCLDKRLVTKSYGKIFLKSLPPCRTVFENSEKVFSEMKKFYETTQI